MINIDTIVDITIASDLKILEKEIDTGILEAAREGKTSYVIRIARAAEKTYEKYKEVTRKYESTYKVSYGTNHFYDYLITISWRHKIEN